MFNTKKFFKTTTSLCALSAAFCFGSINPAFSQAEQTGIADPGRIGTQFEEQTILPTGTALPRIGALQTEGAPEGAENIRFVLNTVSFDGLESLSDAQARRVYGQFIGQEITLAQLYGISNALTAEYRNNGFILTRVVIPPQTIDGGNVTFQVVEGFINNIVIQGPEEEETALNLIRDYAANISTGGALNLKQLERELLLINDLPGVSARSVISPSQTAGAADLLIIVERKPWDALLSIDNYGSRYLGPVQVSGAYTANSWLGYNEAISAQVAWAPDRTEMAYGALSYEQPIGKLGTKIRFFGSKTFTEPGYDLRQFEVEGQSSVMSAQVSHPFIRSRSVNLTGRALFDWRNVESKNNIDDTIHDRLRVARLGGRFDFLDSFLGVAVNAIDLELSRGLDIFGASDEGDSNMTRDLGDPQFTKVEGEFQRFQRLNDDFNLLMVGRGQWANNPLLSSEEFSVGGIGLGRGYDPSEISGDDGISGKLELQWDSPYATQSTFIDGYQLYSFFEAGRVWDQDPTTSSQERDSISSAGAGVRIDFTGNVRADFAVAVPLTREVQTQGDTDPRFLFGVNKRF